MRDRAHALQTVQRFQAEIGRNGTLELRAEHGRTPSYCVRFRVRCPATGAVHQHRVDIGCDPELHDCVRTAIMAREIRRRQKLAARAEAARRRRQELAAEAEIAAQYRTSRRNRRLVRRAYRESQTSGRPFVSCLYGILNSRPKAGRPLKNRLW